MLTIRAAKAVAYYEAPEFAADDYYAEGGRATGRWAGRGAEALGLAGKPDDGDLAALLAGRDPATGAELPGRRGRRPSNVAFDLTFAAPKSVSVLMAIGDEGTRRAVIAAHQAGVRAGLDYLEREACFVRRGRDGVEVLPGEGFIGATYTHEMARSGDPHLHTHLVIANRVKGPDGRYTAPDMRPVYAQAKTAGTIADAVMRDRLSRALGVEWTEVHNGIAELAGVPEAVREHFSARHAEILEEAAARGWGTSPAALAVLQRETRDHKPRIDRARAQAEWRARAAEHGLGADDLRGLLGRARPVREAQRRARLAAHVERMASSAGLTARSSTFTRGQVIEALASAHPEGLGARRLEELATAFLAARAVEIAPARTEPGRGRVPALWTTPEHLVVEARLIEIASGEDPAGALVAPAEAVERAIAARPTLGEDQAAAVRALCGGPGRVRVLEARAGSGKSYALAAVREAYASAGVPVIGTAWQGRAAEVLGREAGVESETTALLLERRARGEEPIPPGAVVVVDEAGTMPTHAMERLLSAVAARGGRAILAGDARQLPAIAAGGALAGLAERLGAAELTGNRRQADELQREVAGRLAAGDAAGAVRVLAERGRLAGYADAREARAALVARWADEALHQPERALILAHDRREVAALNALARAEREAAGLLGAERLIAGGREWAVGDRLTCRRNDYRLDVRNGTRGSVVALELGDGSLTLRTDEGRTVRLPAGYLHHAEHGYAATGHVSQGETVDRTYLLASPGRGGSEWAYVAGSRHRIDLRVYAVHHEGERLEEALAAAWSRSQAKRLALDLASTERRAAAVAKARAQLAEELPERLAERLAELRREREALGAVLRTYPEGAAARARALRAEGERADARAIALERAGAAARNRLSAVPAWRRRERGALMREAFGLEQEARGLGQARDAALRQAEAIEQGPRGPGRWEVAHPGVRERYRETAVELRSLEHIARGRSIARTPARTPPELTRVLGHRTGEAQEIRLWAADRTGEAAHFDQSPPHRSARDFGVEL